MRITFYPILFSLFLSATGAWAYEHTISPDDRFEAYTTPRNPDGTGMRLFIRRAGGVEPGVLLRENDRWIEASWSPDSRFLALIDGSDGHVTDVFVYRITRPRHQAATTAETHYLTFRTLGEIADSALASGIAAKLWYHTPDPWTYDVKWAVRGWAQSGNAILLVKNTRASKAVQIRIVLKSP